MSVVIYIIDGRLTADPKARSYGDGKTMCQFNLASNIGFGDRQKTVYHNCTAFGKSGEAIMKHFHKGDQIIVQGQPTQNKDSEGKWWYGVTVMDWSFGASKRTGEDAHGDSDNPNPSGDNPFNDDDIPF